MNIINGNLSFVRLIIFIPFKIWHISTDSGKFVIGYKSESDLSQTTKNMYFSPLDKVIQLTVLSWFVDSNMNMGMNFQLKNCSFL